jgi:hypothetical protein
MGSRLEAAVARGVLGGSRGTEMGLTLKFVAAHLASLRDHALVDVDALTSGLREELIAIALQRQLEVVAAARLERRVPPGRARAAAA